MQKPRLTIFLSLGLLATGVIAYELALMQVFSITQWYHFAYMVLSVAMLGFGAAGTFLSLFERWLLERYERLFPGLLFLCGMAMATVVGISNGDLFRFDTYLLFVDLRQVGKLVLTYLLFFLPFFLAALAIGLTFVRFVGEIGRLYFADLFGSGLGGLLSLGLMWFFLPQVLPGAVAVFPLVAGLVSMKKRMGKMVWLAAFLSIAAVSWGILHPPPLKLSEYKGITKTLLLPEAVVEAGRNSPHGFVQVVSAPALRYAPGLSLNFRETVPVRKAVFSNGDWAGAVAPPSDTGLVNILDFTTTALPYFLKRPDRVLVLSAGTGEQAAYALAKGARQVSMQESNPLILSFLGKELAQESDSLLFHSSLEVHVLEARTFLYTDTNRYDLIVLPMVSSFGGVAGLNALEEQYDMTREAFGEMWRKLQPGGMICISSWMDFPVRTPLKILATLVETLEAEGIHNARDYVVGIRSWGTVTFLLKRIPFTEEDIRRVRAFCQEMQFDPFLARGLKREEREQYNQLQDTLFFACIDAVLSPQRSQFYGTYDFNIRPATDDRPYFSQFIRWKNAGSLAETFGVQGLPFLEIGYLIVLLTFFQLLLTALVLILLPLFRIRVKSGNRWRIVGYFGGIGLGYMFVEIVLIQRFILYFGHPIYATAAVVSCLLIASGMGSFFSSKWRKEKYRTWMAPALIISLLLLLAILLNPLLIGTIAWPIWGKVAMLLVLVMPVGFFMGIPFPIGISSLAGEGSGAVPWAWGINGYFSVISTALATITAVELGFWWVMIGAIAGYLLAVQQRT